MKQKSIKNNVIMNMILTMSSFVFPLITFPYVSRILMPEGIGKVSFATSLVSYFLMFSQLGIPTYAVRTCAKVRDNKKILSKTAQELLIINVIMAVVSYIFLLLSICIIPKLQVEKTLYLIISSTIFLTAIGVEWLYKALEQYTYIAIRSIIFKFLALVAMFCLVHEESDYVIYGAISIFAASASYILNFINVRKYIYLSPVGKYELKRHIKPILVFFAMACATTIYTNLDSVMLGFMKTDTDVGYYNAAIKIKTILVSVVTSLGVVLLPRSSYYLENNMEDEFRYIASKAMNFVFVAAIPLTIYFFAYAQEGICFLSGEAYLGSIIPMQIIMPTVIFIGITSISGTQMLVPLGREKFVLYSEILGAVTDVLLNLALIPKFAAAGAAIGTLVAEFVVLLVQFMALKDEGKLVVRNISVLKILVACILGFFGSIWIKKMDLNIFNTLVISATLFFMIYCVALVCLKERIAMDVLESIKQKFAIKH